ncbi:MULTISPECIES: holo-ACP synthase [Bacillus]|uniref:Holo-[acyl-carrier-protein] synthase n=2 Tax=Bacillus TaxID=1386 RepID=A0A0M3RAU4_9BACI|nr:MULTISPECIES: holo-ACP synthase [Bacillus]ALC83806.1 4'-phosphopantetheinyl transferase [Bacillus gobiensis]MBP1084037.1 holo-[acyl-carrier protein] synthase [Bacillus capparidis]MED1096919.1 holo-ACP synthase [Bacillus capparidis]
MIIGIGIDLIELRRINDLIKRQEKFADRVLAEEELNIYKNLSNKKKPEYLAGRFAAKEAFSKALGTGIGAHLSFQDIVTETDDRGKPTLFCQKTKDKKIHLSITHTREYAAAQVIIEE